MLKQSSANAILKISVKAVKVLKIKIDDIFGDFCWHFWWFLVIGMVMNVWILVLYDKEAFSLFKKLFSSERNFSLPPIVGFCKLEFGIFKEIYQTKWSTEMWLLLFWVVQIEDCINLSQNRTSKYPKHLLPIKTVFAVKTYTLQPIFKRT